MGENNLGSRQRPLQVSVVRSKWAVASLDPWRPTPHQSGQADPWRGAPVLLPRPWGLRGSGLSETHLAFRPEGRNTREENVRVLTLLIDTGAWPFIEFDIAMIWMISAKEKINCIMFFLKLTWDERASEEGGGGQYMVYENLSDRRLCYFINSTRDIGQHSMALL